MLKHQINPDTREVETTNVSIDLAYLQRGLKTLNDAIINLGTYKKVNSNYGDKAFILQSIYNRDYNTIREISEYFYEANGIYYRLCRYLAYLYRYDWYVTTRITDTANTSKAQKDFARVLDYLDKSNIKIVCGEIALNVVKSGAYYGCIMDFGNSFGLQKLPPAYCRSRFRSRNLPVVELNMRFFDDQFKNTQYRLQVLDLFPKEIKKAYILYKQGKLKNKDDDYGKDGWYMLAPGSAICIRLNESQMPVLFNIIPSLIDLDQAQDLDRKKTMQQLLKIIVQKLPRDKNGDLIFDMAEAKDIHNNAVMMLKRAVGIDVLTTFADIEKIDTRDNNSTTTTDDLQKVERSVYNASGTSHNLFNSDGNLATTNSILNDEASINELVLQLQAMFNMIVEKFDRKNHYNFSFNMLETTWYNYKELAKMYKEHTTIGFSKVLPQVALGESQSSILATAHFENEVLHLGDIMVPPMMSSTRSEKDLNQGKTNQTDTSKTQNQQDSKSIGRPEKEDSQKSDKTIQNRESES